jgi:hypothetical protein
MFGWGNRVVECGPFRLAWNYPTNVAFKFLTNPPKVYELAPTKWQEISEVNLRDLHLTWYAYDEKRETRYVPIDDLW